MTVEVGRAGVHEDENAATIERHNVTFWDFAGQDIYQVAHTLFFSKRTLYLLCIDLEMYAKQLEEMRERKEAHTLTAMEGHAFVQRFFDENVLRWLRLVLLRHTDAQFRLIGTKRDKVSNSQWTGVRIDLNLRLLAFLEDRDRQVTIQDDIRCTLANEFDQPMLTTSVMDRESLHAALQSIQRTIVSNSNLSFSMPKAYTQVLEYIVRERRLATQSETRKEQLEKVIVPIHDICDRLMREVAGLTGGACRDILRTLHNLGDVRWYEDYGEDFKDLIILDLTILLDIIREVINHEYDGKSGEEYDAIRRDGTVQHSLLMSCKSWKALDPTMIPMFKSLLLRFNLAYPANRVKPPETVDMIVPVYWKTREAAQALGRSLLRQQSVLARNFVVGASVAKWNYSLPIGISEAIFVKFVVRSYTYRPNANRAVKDNYFECFVRGEFGATISFITDEAKKCDDITIEVAAVTTDLAWSEMRYFVIAMEQILLQYRGLEANGTLNVKRCIVDLRGNVPGVSHDVNFLFAEDQSKEQLRRANPWLPPDFKWFIERVWTSREKLDELELSHELTVLKRLVVNSEKRRFPAVWTISYLENSSEIELRMHSDLSGKCYHKPLLISNPNGFARFVADNAVFIQVDISVLSVASAAIPIAVVSAAVELALSTSRDLVDGVSTVKSVLDRAHLDPGEAKASKDMTISPEARMGFLKKLLELYDPSFDESSVSDAANLCCATTKYGSYVWVHKSEMQKLHGYIMPCADISIDISYLEGFRTAGHTSLRKKVYCSWEITYGSSPQPIEFGFTEEALWTSDAGPLWASSAIKLRNVNTVEMLHECTLKVWVNQARQFTACFRGEKEIGRGEEELKNHVPSDQCSSTTIEIPISLSEMAPITHQEFCVICQLKIEFPGAPIP